MLNKYWRSFPWYIQLLQFIVLIVVMASFFLFALSPVIMHWTGVTAEDIRNLDVNSTDKTVNTTLLIQFLSSSGIFLLPALLFAYFTHPRPAGFLGLRKPGRSVHWLLPALIMLAAAPLLTGLAGWLEQMVDLGGSVKQMQEENNRMFSALLAISNPVQLLITFTVLAILPGFSEELFFRGIIMRFAAKRSYSIAFPLVVSALMFALLHSNIYGLPSIFTAGLLLGGFYYLTGSIWPSIIAHTLFNGTQVLLSYLGRDNALGDIVKQDNVPLSWVMIGTPIAIAAFFLLWKTRTPLKPHWAADYDPKEIMDGSE